MCISLPQNHKSRNDSAKIPTISIQTVRRRNPKRRWLRCIKGHVSRLEKTNNRQIEVRQTLTATKTEGKEGIKTACQQQKRYLLLRRHPIRKTLKALCDYTKTVHFTKSQHRATKTTHTRRYRYTKKNPRSQIATFKIDRGNVEQVISLFFPQNSQFSDFEIPKEKNPDLITFNIGNTRFAYYYKDKKGFVYNCDGIYLGSFEKHDLKHAFSRIGAILWAVQKQKG